MLTEMVTQIDLEFILIERLDKWWFLSLHIPIHICLILVALGLRVPWPTPHAIFLRPADQIMYVVVFISNPSDAFSTKCGLGLAHLQMGKISAHCHILAAVLAAELVVHGVDPRVVRVGIGEDALL